MSVSFKTSSRKTNIKHNNRTLDDEEKLQEAHSHIDFTRSHENIYIKQQSLEDAYDELFGEALQEYNAKQTRNDRKIKNYLTKVRKDGNLDVQREFIIQLGDMEFFNSDEAEDGSHILCDEANREYFSGLLTDYVDDFQERNPRLHVYNAVVHMDEATPHLHLNVIPVAEGYSKGLKRQPSFSRALANQGFNSTGKHQFVDFRMQEIGELEKVLSEEGIKRKEVGTNAIRDMYEYKEYRRKIAEKRNEYTELLQQNIEAYDTSVKLKERIELQKEELKNSPEIKELDQKISSRKKELASLETMLESANEKVSSWSKEEQTLDSRIAFKRAENDKIFKTWESKTNVVKTNVEKVIENAQPRKIGGGVVISDEAYLFLKRIPVELEKQFPFSNISAENRRLRKRENEQNDEIKQLKESNEQLSEENEKLNRSLFISNERYEVLEKRVEQFIGLVKEVAQNNKVVSFIRDLGYRSKDTHFESEIFESFSDDEDYFEGYDKRILEDNEKRSNFARGFDMER